MTKSDVITAINTVLDEQYQDDLRWFLENQTRTIYYLATLKNKRRKKPSGKGVCAEIQNTGLVRALSPSWKHFSGNSVYPVPGRSKKQDPELAYYEDYASEEKWIGQQKRYRFSLIDHLLKNAPYFYKEVEKRLKQL